MKPSIHFGQALWGAALLLASAAGLGVSSAEIVDSAYRADVPFPQFLPLWSEGWALKDKSGEPLQYARTNMPLGAYVQVCFRNSSANTLAGADVLLEGISLTKAIAFSPKKQADLYPASIHLSGLAKDEIAKLSAAGEPVWWKIEPGTVSPGGFGEVTIRLRRQASKPLAVQVVATNAAWSVQVGPERSPAFAGISFSQSLDTVYCYLRNESRPPAIKLLLDGVDVTDRTTIAVDPAIELSPLVLRLKEPLQRGSFHVFEAAYPDGSRAWSGMRAWSDEMVYGMWGYVNHGSTAQERVDYYLGDLQRHNVNAVMESYGGEVGEFLSGAPGSEHSRTTGIRAMRRWPDKVLEPVYYFLKDEPDAHDFAVKQLDPRQRLGALGQDLVRHSRQLRERAPAVPQLLNLDNTFKPENWYMYAQLADVCCADPYFQEQQRIVWNERPAWVPYFLKPLYVLGVATICNSACAPKPLHIILNAVRHDHKEGPFRFATPAEKTVELFYALGSGAKGVSYWWYTPYGEFHGCGGSEPEAVALWRQIGLLGAQVRTVGSVLQRSCPASVPVRAPAKLWSRTLLAGTDTLVLLAVNDNIVSDRLGTVVVPLPEASLSLTPPLWLKAAEVFEVVPEGVRQVKWKNDGGRLVLDLGKTEVVRLILLTSDTALRGQLEALYRSCFAQPVAQLARQGRIRE